MYGNILKGQDPKQEDANYKLSLKSNAVISYSYQFIAFHLKIHSSLSCLKQRNNHSGKERVECFSLDRWHDVNLCL